jgi:hypothetical protein
MTCSELYSIQDEDLGMPVTVSYPGVYVYEVPSTVHGVVAATTSATAFVGWFARGAVGEAVHVNNLNQFQREFGGLHRQSEASYAITQYFANGGSDAWLVRLQTDAVAASVAIDIINPTADDIVTQTSAQVSAAWTAANAAWVEVYGDGPGLGFSPSGSPPDSPPIALASLPASPLVPTDPTTEADALADLKTIGGIATQAGKNGLLSATAVLQAATLVDEAAALVAALFAAASPTLLHDTWKAAELAAAAAVDAAALAQQASERAAQLAQDVDGTLPGTADQKAHLQAASDAAAAARTAAIIAANAAEEASAAAEGALAAAAGTQLIVNAANPGAWGNCLRVFLSSGPKATFNLTVSEIAIVRGRAVTVNSETYLGLTLTPGALKNAIEVVNDESALITLGVTGTLVPDASVPETSIGQPASTPVTSWTALTNGADGAMPTVTDLNPADPDVPQPDWSTQLKAIAPSVFNILCIPDTINLPTNAAKVVFDAANQLCSDAHSIYLFDIPAERAASLTALGKLPQWMSDNGFANEEAFASATYVPALVIPDPLNNYRDRIVGPSGTMAGVFARTDTARGVWKAPAGVAAVLQGADVALKVGDDDNGALNEAGINVLRTFPTYGPIAWGARTLAGADLLDSEWKYINVRRLIDYIEQSLFQSLKWVVFEPNTETTWSQIRLEVGTFLNGLFSAGAFSGSSPGTSYFVRCDATTTTPDDIARGVVNILVGVAPDKPAEFVVLQIEQIAAQAAA